MTDSVGVQRYMQSAKIKGTTTLPTVVVVDPNRPDQSIIINQSDFKEGVHQLVGAAKPQKEAPPKDPADPKQPTAEERDELLKMTLAELQKLPEAAEVQGVSSMNKVALVDAILRVRYEE